MKLLTITTRYFLLLLLGLLIPWTIWFYGSIRYIIYHQVDEFLANRKFEITRETTQHPSLLRTLPGYKTDFTWQPITAEQMRTLRETYSDTMVWEPLEGEKEPYRKLETPFESGGKYFKLTILASLTDTQKLLSTLLRHVVTLFVVLFILLVLLNRVILRRLWRPFHAALAQIRTYRLDRHVAIEFEQTSVLEFGELHAAFSQLISHTQQAYQQQKEFTENASHEIQTPLAIARNQVELLSQDAELSTSQAQRLDSIEKNLSRMARLNKSLLLLAKIENNQFPETKPLELPKLIQTVVEQLDEMIEYKNLRVSVENAGEPLIRMNPDLAEVFFGNLVRNAVFHNIPGGYIRIELDQQGVLFENSGPELTEVPANLFGRFVKNAKASSSQGLGLSLVQSISKLYGFSVEYTHQQGTHRLSVTF